MHLCGICDLRYDLRPWLLSQLSMRHLAAGTASSGRDGEAEATKGDESGSSERGGTFEWEWRLLDAADLVAEQKGHLWLMVSAAEGTEWREALLARGYRPRTFPEGEADAAGQWLFKATPLRDRVA